MKMKESENILKFIYILQMLDYKNSFFVVHLTMVRISFPHLTLLCSVLSIFRPYNRLPQSQISIIQDLTCFLYGLFNLNIHSGYVLDLSVEEVSHF